MNKPALCAFFCFSLCTLPKASAQKNDHTLRDYLRSKQMIHVPEIDQNRPSPGSIIVVQYDGNKMLQPDFLWAKKDLPASKQDSITLPQQIVTSSLRISGGASIYGVDIAGMFNHSNDLNYKPEDAPTEEFEGDLDDLLDATSNSATYKQVLRYTMQSNDGTPTHPAFSAKYDLYLVEAVYRGGNLDITATTSNGLALLKGKSADSKCKAPSLPKAGDQAGSPQTAPTDAATGNAASSSVQPKPGPAKDENTADANIPSGPNIDLCLGSGGQYKLTHTPPVAFGMKVKHIYWDADDRRLETEPVNTNKLSFDM